MLFQYFKEHLPATKELVNSVSKAKQLIGRYYVFRPAFALPGYINISTIEVTQDQESSAYFFINKRERFFNKNKSTDYLSKGVVLAQSHATLLFHSIAESINDPKNTGKNIETISLRTKWAENEIKYRRNNGIYHGLCSMKNLHPISLRVLMIKIEDKDKSICLNVKFDDFCDDYLITGENEILKNKLQSIKDTALDNDDIAEDQKIGLDDVKEGITGGICKKYNGLRHWSESAKEYEKIEKRL